MWQMILGISTIASVIINSIMFITIKFNDLSHLQKGVDELKKDVKFLCDEVNVLSQRVSHIEGKLDKN